jgi:hypothetical protein
MIGRKAWLVAYYVLFAGILVTGALNMLHVHGAFLTNHAADVCVPAWLYVASRGLHSTHGRTTLVQRTIGRTPEVAALSLFAASAITLRLRRTWRASLLRASAVIVVMGSVLPAEAQTPSMWRDGAFAFTANVAIGAATSLARSMLKGRRDRARPAFWGALGGAVAFAGKSIPPETHSPQGLAGFGLGAIGVSIVDNAADGLAPLARVTVPLGPLRLRVVSGDGPTVQFALNAHDAIVLAKRVSNSDHRFDLPRTLTSGAVTFLAERRPITNGVPGTVDGVTTGSVIVRARGRSRWHLVT